MIMRPSHLAMRTNYANMAWNHELVGDPFGGPAYGAKEKGGGGGLGKIVGIVAAVASVATGVGMLGSTSLLTQIAGGAMAAGGVMSGIGTVTGNQKLAKIGGTLSLLGGIGSMAGDVSAAMGKGQSFGDALGSAGSSMRDGLNDSLSRISTAWESVSQATPTIDGGGISGSTSMNTAAMSGDRIGALNTAGDGFSKYATSDLGTQPTLGARDAFAQPTIGQGGLLSQPATDSAALGSGLKSGFNPTSGLGFQAPGGADMAAKALNYTPQTQSTGLLGWMKENPSMSFLAGQGVSGALGGIGNYAAAQEQTKAAEDALNRADENKARELANINGGMLFLDPYSANYQTNKAKAQAMGIRVQDFGINPTAGAPTTAQGTTAGNPNTAYQPRIA